MASFGKLYFETRPVFLEVPMYGMSTGTFHIWGPVMGGSQPMAVVELVSGRVVLVPANHIIFADTVPKNHDTWQMGQMEDMKNWEAMANDDKDQT